jgi:hypothetical protein
MYSWAAFHMGSIRQGYTSVMYWHYPHHFNCKNPSQRRSWYSPARDFWRRPMMQQAGGGRQ